MQKLVSARIVRQVPDLRLGIEIAHSCVKLAAVRRTSDGPRLERFAVEPLPSGAVSEGVVRQPDAVISALASLRRRCSLGRTEIVTALPDTAVQFKMLRVQKGTEPRQVVALAQREARQLIRDPSIPITVDIAVLGESAVGDQVQDLLLVAAKSVDVRRHADLFRQAGWNPTVLEVDSMVVKHGVAHPTTHYQSGAPVIALFDLGAGGIHLTVLRGEQTVFHRARAWSAAIVDSAQDPIASEPFLDCVRSLLQGFHRHTGIEHLDRLQVTGGLSLDPRWVAELADWVGLAAESWQPGDVVDIGQDLDEQERQQLNARSFVAVSLALRGFE